MAGLQGLGKSLGKGLGGALTGFVQRLGKAASAQVAEPQLCAQRFLYVSHAPAEAARTVDALKLLRKEFNAQRRGCRAIWRRAG